MRLGLQEELESVLGHKVMPYWKAYLLGIPTLFIYTLVWMAGISEELKAKAIEMGIEGPHTSWWHMFGWNVFGILLMEEAIDLASDDLLPEDYDPDLFAEQLAKVDEKIAALKKDMDNPAEKIMEEEKSRTR